MAVWADLDEDDEASSLVHTQLTAYRPRDDGDDEADQRNGYEADRNGSSAYIAHALRCYPYARCGRSLRLTH